MDSIRRTLKIQLLGIIIFAAITALFVLILMVTPIKEIWSYTALIIALSVTCLFVGILQGKAIGKRGLLSGILSSALIVILILTIIKLAFNGDFKPENNDIILVIPLIVGAAGGVVGANTDK